MPAPASSARVRSALGERGALRAADEHERREVWVAQRADAGGVQLGLILQSRQRTQAGDPGRVGIDEPEHHAAGSASSRSV